MHKKAIFIPLLLLVIQPNKTLGANNRYEQAKKEIEKVLKSPRNPIPDTIDGFYSSHNDEVNKLLKLVQEKSQVFYNLATSWNQNLDPNLTPYYAAGIAIIEQHYPNVDLWVEKSGADIKG